MTSPDAAINWFPTKPASAESILQVYQTPQAVHEPQGGALSRAGWLGFGRTSRATGRVRARSRRRSQLLRCLQSCSSRYSIFRGLARCTDKARGRTDVVSWSCHVCGLLPKLRRTSGSRTIWIRFGAQGLTVPESGSAILDSLPSAHSWWLSAGETPCTKTALNQPVTLAIGHPAAGSLGKPSPRLIHAVHLLPQTPCPQ